METTTTTTRAQAPKAESGNPAVPEVAKSALDSLGSMWSGLVSGVGGAGSASEPNSAPKSTSGAGAPENTQSGTDAPSTTAPSSSPTSWLSDAGKLWETAVRDVGERIRSVELDASAFERPVAQLRDASGKFVDGVSRSVQGINLSLDQEKLQEGAANFQNSTRELFGLASEQLQRGTREAMELFVDAPADEQGSASSQPKCPPWDPSMLKEDERKYSDALRTEMLKIVVDSIYSKKRRTELFLSQAAQKAQFKFDFESNSGIALAALEADINMRRLRAGLVPAKMKEDDFWDNYFYHVERVKRTLRANNGVMPKDSVDDDVDAATLFAEDGEDEELAVLGESKTSNAKGDIEGTRKTQDDAVVKDSSKLTDSRNWDDEIDAIFDAKDNA